MENQTQPETGRTIVFKPTPKQFQAWEKLRDNVTTEIGFGGGAGGGKTILGCSYIISTALAYPDTGHLIGRKELVNLKRTTLLSFYQVCKDLGIIPDQDFTYNQQQSVITFQNKSQIFLLDLSYQPSDPLYTRLGGLELTDAFVDQSEEVPPEAIDILKTRIGRRKNKEYGLIPKLFETFNPAKNHVYQRYYKPWREGTLPEHMAFIQALPTDNKYLAPEYVEQLRRSDKVTVMRLLHGNFEYDDDPATLCSYDHILDLFTNTVTFSEQKFLVADIARLGSDRIVFTFWRGLRLYKIVVYRKMGIDETAIKLQEHLAEEQIPYSQCIVDADGIGGGVFDLVRGVKGFVANSRPFQVQNVDASPMTSRHVKTLPPENYRHLKAQCAYLLAEKVAQHQMRIDAEGSLRGEIIEELEQLKAKDVDSEGKKDIIPKDEMKEILRRSPDLLDCLIMRMWFELNQSKATSKVRVRRPDYSKTGYGQSGKNMVRLVVEKPQ